MTSIPELDLLQGRRNRLLNTLHTWLLGTGSLLLLAVTAWIFAGGTGIVYALVFGAVSLWLVRRASPTIVLGMYKAREVTEAEFPFGVQMVRELAGRAGLTVAPKLYVVPSNLMNAFAVGRPEDAAIAITDPLVRRLTRRELAGVLAHEISHVAHEDVRVMAFADMVSRFTSFMSTIGIVSLFLNLLGFAGGYETQVPWAGVVLLVASPTVGGLLQMALSRTREYDADLGAALLTGDPDGLASALVKLERAQGIYWESLVLPGSRTPVPSVLRTHPPTAERVKRLMALKGVDVDPGDIAGLRPPAARASFIPRVPRRSSAMDTRLVGSLLQKVAPLRQEGDEHEPPGGRPLAAPEGRPRIRPMRGGVFW